MPFDLKIENGDIVIDPFDIQLNTQGLEAVGQRIDITLNTFKGEFFLNTEFGAPWYQTVLRKGVSKNLIDTQLRKVITSVEGVLQLLEYSSIVDPAFRTISVTFKARVDEGIIDSTIDVSELIIVPTGNAILQESGDAILQEDNVSLILQE